MKILIDNGHGIDTPGKRSPDAVNGLTNSPLYFREYLWAREIAAACASALTFDHYDVELLVPEDTDISLKERTRRVNQWCDKLGSNNVILISIHNNAAGNGSSWMNARGWAIYTSVGTTKSDILADEIAKVAKDEFKAPLSVRFKKDKYLERDQEENFYILKNTKCPAVLIENFFQDNKEDVKYLKSDMGKGSCIHVITQGIKNYLSL